MCDQIDTDYSDGEVVWVKLGSCWWPGEVVAPEKLPPDLLSSFRKPPIAVVKFFLEDSYEYVKNSSSIYRYNCSRKTEFIKKGLDVYRTRHGLSMEKFPEDVIRAETATGGDIEILTRDEFQQEAKKESYAGLFGGSKKTPGPSNKKGKASRASNSQATPTRKVSSTKSDYKVHILVQGSKPTQSSSVADISTPTTSVSPEPLMANPTPALSTPPNSSTSGLYTCHACPFTTSRLNVMIMHNKTHSSTFIPYTPSPAKKKSPAKPLPKSTSNTPKPVKVQRPRPEKIEAEKKEKKPPKKRVIQEKPEKSESPHPKKPKTDEEIKTSLLADWDDGDEEFNDQSSVVMNVESPEIAVGPESPAVPTPAELPIEHSSKEISVDCNKLEDLPRDEKEAPVDSKYEFCEDEDWSLEADIGRKIPRVKNPAKRKEDTKSLDENEVAREVAELLNKTTVPELPSVPDLLKVEENFPERSIAKSPDKNPDKPPDFNVTLQISTSECQASKPTIFKTKTFFRSRHSRSQDAIGKYVAEQLNAERVDLMDSDINGTEVTSSPEARDSPPIEYIKVTKLAPKIQLKKMKAEAAQLQEKVKSRLALAEQEIVPMSSVNDRLDVPMKDEPQGFNNQSEIKHENSSGSGNKTSATDCAFVELEHNDDLRSKPNVSEEVNKITEFVSNIKHNDAITNNFNEVVNITHFADDKNNSDNNTKFSKTDSAQLEKSHDIEVMNQVVCISETLETDSESVSKSVIQQRFAQDMSYPTQEIKPIENESIFTKQENKSIKAGDIKINHLNNSTIINTGTSEPNFNMSESKLQSKSLIQKHEISTEHHIDTYMNESTASAVDALLSVSRETDKVTKNISDDPPDELFDDDFKDNVIVNVNGLNDKEYHKKEFLHAKTQHENDILAKQREPLLVENNHIIVSYNKPMTSQENDVNNFSMESMVKNEPSESDLQIAEALINLPSTAIQNNKTSNEHQENETKSDFNSEQISIEEEHFQEEIVHTSDMHHNQICDMEVDDKPTLNNKVSSDSTLKIHNADFDSEREISENLNAAQSLVQMSESIEHNINIVESDMLVDKEIANPNTSNKSDEKDASNAIELNEVFVSSKNTSDSNDKQPKFEPTSSKLLQILEEPTIPKSSLKPRSTQKILLTGNEKILNFDVGKSTMRAKNPKQKIIIRRTTAKNIINSISDAKPDKIILSCNNKAGQDGSPIQTYTITGPLDSSSDANKIIIQPKLTKINKPPPKLQKIKHPSTFVLSANESKTTVENQILEDTIFDINSMPVVLSDDILTPESIDKMPLVTSDGNIITNPQRLVKIKPTTQEIEKNAISIVPVNQDIKTYNKAELKVTSKPDLKTIKKAEMKTLLMNPVSEQNKATTPNILSKSAKSRGGKPMFFIDKNIGKQKIIMNKSESVMKDVNQVSKIQPVTQNTGKTEKFIILPSPSSPRPGRAQKIVIDPQSGKAHVLVTKGPDVSISTTENKPVSAKLIPSVSDISNPGNTVMIITNAQGTQSRIVLTPEHEKILFPNKQQANLSQIKTVTHRITSPGNAHKTTIVSTTPPLKPHSKVITKQKSAIITSKGQLIVSGGVVSTAQSMSPQVPELRPALKRIAAAEPKTPVQTIQKTVSEPLIFLQQKSGAVMQLTAAQFEHLQRTGQIVQKPSTPVQQKIIVQKSVTIPPPEPTVTIVQKQRVKRTVHDTPVPLKKTKHEIAIAPSPSTISLASPIVTISKTISPSPVVSASSSSTAVNNYPELDNFEELLPSTAIVRQPEATSVIAPPEPVVAPPPVQLADGQLLAVPGENFGGPQGTFYLCIEDNGTLTPIDNRPLVLENNQLVPMAIEPLPILAPQPERERRDILEAALANSDVFHADSPRDDAPDFRDLNANVSVHCRVSETSTTLNQPIMTPIEVPSKADCEPTTVPSNLEDGLAVIGVTPQTVPTSLELPITVTDPRIAPKTTNPLTNNNYGTTLLTSPNSDIPFLGNEDVPVGPISMPLLTDDESVGKSMPLLTDDIITEKTVSSVDSTIGSPSSIDVRESETEDGSQWSHRRLLTPGSDTSETSAEIPLQPSIQLSMNDLSHCS